MKQLIKAVMDGNPAVLAISLTICLALIASVILLEWRERYGR